MSLALLALCPFLVVSAASALFREVLMGDLSASAFGIGLASALAEAGYAFGAVLAADLVQRMPTRRVYLTCEVLFVAGSLLALCAPGIVAFTIGRTVQGVVTGMLLVAALPPLVTNHGADKLPLTAAFISLGLFGVTTLGPLVGGIVGSTGIWRPLFAIVAALGVAGVGTGLLAFEPTAPQAPGMAFDSSGIPLAVAATALPFLGVSFLASGSFGSPAFAVPVGAGLVALVALVAAQFFRRRPLMPVRLIAHTLPVSGILVAMVTGAAFTALVELTETYSTRILHQPPVVVGLALTTQLAGVVVAAWLFKTMLTTRWLPVLALGGLATVTAAAALLLALSPGTAPIIVPVSGLLLGFGAGAGVAPALFMAGLSAPSSKLGPTFALVELLRSVAAFLVAPILLQLATSAADPMHGFGQASFVTLLVLVAGGAAAVAVLVLGGAHPHAPDLEQWLDGDSPGYHSPQFAALVRS